MLKNDLRMETIFNWKMANPLNGGRRNLKDTGKGENKNWLPIIRNFNVWLFTLLDWYAKGERNYVIDYLEIQTKINGIKVVLFNYTQGDK